MIAAHLFPAALAAAMLLTSPAAASPLDRYRWKARVLVIAGRTDDPRVAAQRRVIEAEAAGARERDLVVVEGLGADAAAQALRTALGLPPEGFRAVLVGKDGGAKLTAREPIPAQDIFGTIDAMPMRRDEAARRR
ncbi:DUF4174 domain-containing protein [Methylobacterium sp. JK268]